MHNFMAILSQLFWGVTIGALSAAFETLAKGMMMIGGLGGAGWYGLKWRKARRDRDSKPDKRGD